VAFDVFLAGRRPARLYHEGTVGEVIDKIDDLYAIEGIGAAASNPTMTEMTSKV